MHLVNLHTSRVLETAVHRVAREVGRLVTPIKWYLLGEEGLFYELVACVLGSRVTFEHAQSAAAHLSTQGLLRISVNRSRLKGLESRITTALCQRAFLPRTTNGTGRRYRFPNVAARNISCIIQALYDNGISLTEMLSSSGSGCEARAALVGRNRGIGPKQASLFLRNVGFSDNLAILDSRVLKFMQLIGLIPKPLTTVSSMDRYEEIESILSAYSSDLKTSLSDLDTAIWVVMRVHDRSLRA